VAVKQSKCTHDKVGGVGLLDILLYCVAGDGDLDRDDRLYGSGELDFDRLLDLDLKLHKYDYFKPSIHFK
jgi:hypothetical protein